MENNDSINQPKDTEQHNSAKKEENDTIISFDEYKSVTEITPVSSVYNEINDINENNDFPKIISDAEYSSPKEEPIDTIPFSDGEYNNLDDILGFEDTIYSDEDIDTDGEPLAEEENEVLEGQLEIDFGDTPSSSAEHAADKTNLSKDKKNYDPENPRRIDVAFDFAELFIFALVAVLLFTTFFFRHSVVDGTSMENTLEDGEHLIISNLFYTPQRGDIIVCEDYSTNLRKPIVKRVIAIAGDHITVTPTGKVTLNGEELSEDYVYTNGPVYENAVDLTVPEGEIFVMGDHRNMSTDSRELGTIDEDSVIGRVLIRFYPFDKFGTVE